MISADCLIDNDLDRNQYKQTDIFVLIKILLLEYSKRWPFDSKYLSSENIFPAISSASKMNNSESFSCSFFPIKFIKSKEINDFWEHYYNNVSWNLSGIKGWWINWTYKFLNILEVLDLNIISRIIWLFRDKDILEYWAILNDKWKEEKIAKEISSDLNYSMLSFFANLKKEFKNKYEIDIPDFYYAWHIKSKFIFSENPTIITEYLRKLIRWLKCDLNAERLLERIYIDLNITKTANKRLQLFLNDYLAKFIKNKLHFESHKFASYKDHIDKIWTKISNNNDSFVSHLTIDELYRDIDSKNKKYLVFEFLLSLEFLWIIKMESITILPSEEVNNPIIHNNCTLSVSFKLLYKLKWLEIYKMSQEYLIENTKLNLIKSIENTQIYTENNILELNDKNNLNDKNTHFVVENGDKILDDHIVLVNRSDKTQWLLLNKLSNGKYKHYIKLPPLSRNIIEHLYAIKGFTNRSKRLPELAKLFSKTKNTVSISNQINKISKQCIEYWVKQILHSTSNDAWEINPELSCNA